MFVIICTACAQHYAFFIRDELLPVAAPTGYWVGQTAGRSHRIRSQPQSYDFHKKATIRSFPHPRGGGNARTVKSFKRTIEHPRIRSYFLKQISSGCLNTKRNEPLDRHLLGMEEHKVGDYQALDNVPHVQKGSEAGENSYNDEGTALTMCHMCKTS